MHIIMNHTAPFRVVSQKKAFRYKWSQRVVVVAVSICGTTAHDQSSFTWVTLCLKVTDPSPLRYFWESVSVFETGNVSTWGVLDPRTLGFMSKALTTSVISARPLLFHVFEYWLCRYRYVWSKVKNLNVNYARATTFVFDTRTDVLWKWQFF